MSPNVLNQCVNILTSVYGDVVAKGSRLNSIDKALSMLREKDAITLCEQISSTQRNYPLADDFIKHVYEFKRMYRFKTGKNYDDQDVIEVQFTRVGCDFCFDTGIVKFEHSEPDGFQYLIRCDCETGKTNSSNMPRWDSSLKGGFVKKALNATWFNPKITPDTSEQVINDKIMNKVNEWKKQIKRSEKYWSDLGYKNT